MAPLVPRPRHELVDELQRCATTRRERQEDLIEALVRVDALDHRIATLVDELSLHHRAPA